MPADRGKSESLSGPQRVIVRIDDRGHESAHLGGAASAIAGAILGA
jgi:hypothetical protein